MLHKFLELLVSDPSRKKGQITLAFTTVKSTAELQCHFRTISLTHPEMNMEFSQTCPLTVANIEVLMATIESKLSQCTLNTCFDGFNLVTDISMPLYRDINHFDMTQTWWDTMLSIIKVALIGEVSVLQPVVEPAVTC